MAFLFLFLEAPVPLSCSVCGGYWISVDLCLRAKEKRRKKVGKMCVRLCYLWILWKTEHQNEIPHVYWPYLWAAKQCSNFKNLFRTMTEWMVCVLNIATILPRSDFKNEKIMRIFKHKNVTRIHNSAHRTIFPKWEKSKMIENVAKKRLAAFHCTAFSLHSALLSHSLFLFLVRLSWRGRARFSYGFMCSLLVAAVASHIHAKYFNWRAFVVCLFDTHMQHIVRPSEYPKRIHID